MKEKDFVVKSQTVEGISIYAKSLTEKSHFAFSANRIWRVKQVKNTLVVDGLLYKATILLQQDEKDVTMQVLTKLSWPLNIIIIFTYCFLLLPLILDQVTLNENPTPEFIEKIMYVAIGMAMVSLPVVFLVKGKRAYKEKIKTKLGNIKQPLI